MHFHIKISAQRRGADGMGNPLAEFSRNEIIAMLEASFSHNTVHFDSQQTAELDVDAAWRAAYPEAEWPYNE